MHIKTKTKITIARLLYRLLNFLRFIVGKRRDLVRVHRRNCDWELNLSEGIDLAIFLFGRFEASTVRAYESMVNDGDTVLDIGANIGAHTLFLGHKVGKNGKVIAIEPTDFAFEKLRKNVELNPQLKERVDLNQVMLVEQDSSEVRRETYSSWPLKNKTNLHEQHMGALKATKVCRVMTLDQLIKEKMIENVNFVKLDVDGAEIDVLKGGRETLTKSKPPILMEFAPYLFDGLERGKFSELVGILNDYGYQFYHLHGSPLPTQEAAKIEALIPEGASMNIIAKSV